MSLPQPPLLFITDSAQSSLPLMEVLEGAFRGGCRWMSLRAKALAPEDREEMLRRLLPLGAEYGATVMVHGDIAAAARTGAGGIHLSDPLQVSLARDALGRGALIGISAHGPADIADAAVVGADYVTLSPVFSSCSKPGYGPAIGLERFAEIAACCTLPVIALGGIAAPSVGACLAAGAAGVAVMGEIMRAQQPMLTAAGLVLELRQGARRSSDGGFNNMTRVVAVYQCFFFVAGRIEYWENIESDSDGAIEVLLSQRLSAENWEAAEAWTQDKLTCRISAPASRGSDAQSRSGDGEDEA